MIVYGDPEFACNARAILDVLPTLGKGGNRKPLEAYRDLLIACGQIEQALADASALPDGVMPATDTAAELFFRSYASGSTAPFSSERVLAELAESLEDVPDPLRVKIPEGYAFYSLFPEQYITAAHAWISENAGAQSAAVVGIRSIGTALSALVAAVLRARGMVVRRVTVRPVGHPFGREVQLTGVATELRHAIVADEGPGLSGSSIAAVAAALHAQGIRPISIFPGHANGPGPAASEAVRKIWAGTRTFAYPVLTRNIEESAFVHTFKTRTEQILGSPVTEVRDFSAGQWRDMTGRPGAPAIPELERTKLLVRTASGRALVWKFCGLGYGREFTHLSENAFRRQRRLAQMRWCQPPLEARDGFIASEWLEDVSRDPGQPIPLHSSSARALARYVMDASKPPLTGATLEESLRRLTEMILCNVEESLGRAARERAAGIRVDISLLCDLPAYGDGRLAPHEWLLSEARLVKADVWGHDLDHTCTGPQPILWDIAGAILEWKMPPSIESAFLYEFSVAGLDLPDEALRFYKLAYSAFQLGLNTLFGHRQRAATWEEQLRLSLGM